MRCLLLAVTAVAFRVYDEVPLPPKSYWYLEEENETRQELMKDLGCYCKNVKSMNDCPDFKTNKKTWDPEHARWFHPEVSPGSKTPHLCCKLAWTSWFDRKGLSYTKQETAQRCFSEVRPLSKDACCCIGKEEQVAVRVKQIKREAGQETFGPDFYANHRKSLPYFSVNDIAGATDYNGTALSVHQVIELLQYKVQAGAISHRQRAGETTYNCSKQTVDELIADQDDCRVRTDPTECCCLQASLVPAQRCLPAAGAATVEATSFNGSYTEKEVTKGGETFLQGNLSFPQTLKDYVPGEFVENLDKDLPDLLHSQDPEAADGLEYDWSRATDQWKRPICKANQTFAWVRKGECVEWVRDPIRAIRVTGRYDTFHQEWKTECISWEFNRACPRGQGLYVKQIPLGTCTKVPGPSNSDQLQMVGLGSGLMFQCPDGYQSGTKGAMKSDVRCKCNGC